MTACELLCYASRYGLTAADFKILSIGFVLNFLDMQVKIANNKDIHAAEKKYNRMKRDLPYVEKRYRSGQLDREPYLEFIRKYKALEKRYG